MFHCCVGICSSLLAVIEQLRERQADDVIKGIGDKYKRKRKRSAAFDMVRISNYISLKILYCIALIEQNLRKLTEWNITN